MVIDTETNDVEVESPSTVPVQLGYALVVNHKLVDSDDYYINWTLGDKAIPVDTYQRRLIFAKQGMEAKGKKYHTTWEKVAAHGWEPVEALLYYRALIADALNNGYAIVAHNGYSFDRILLQHWWRRIGQALFIAPNRLVDTGLLEKANQMDWSPPLPGSCPRDYWYNKIRDQHSRVRWSLDTHCAKRYNLSERYKLEMGHAHEAGFDCILCHHLLESMYELSLKGECDAAGNSRMCRLQQAPYAG